MSFDKVSLRSGSQISIIIFRKESQAFSMIYEDSIHTIVLVRSHPRKLTKEVEAIRKANGYKKFQIAILGIIDFYYHTYSKKIQAIGQCDNFLS